MSIHHTRPEHAVLSPHGWLPLDDKTDITALPLWDMAHHLDDGTPLFARLNYDEALAVAAREGASLPKPEHIEQLRLVGLQLMPYLGTPVAENAIEHSMRHDADVWRQLRAAGWAGTVPVAGAGKHWIADAPAGKSRLMGWDKDGAGPGQAWWQPASVAHNRQHFDDGTTTLLVRHALHDTDTAPRSGASWASQVLSPLRSAAAGAAELLGGILGGHELPPRPDATPGGHPLPPRSTMTPDTTLAATFVQARNYRRGRPGPVTLVVLHDMEAAESAKTAENVAAWFAGPQAPMASAHYCVDVDSIVQCVREADTAYHAPGANAQGIGIELAGYARQTTAEWADAYSTAMLDRAAGLVADICRRHSVPVAFVDAAGLLAGLGGVTTHAEVSRAWKRSSHTDPGPSFPLAAFLDSVRARM